MPYQDPRFRIDGVLHLALAPWWKRFLAFLIDNMVIGVALFLVFAIIGAADHNNNTTTTSGSTVSVGRVLIGFAGLFIVISIPYMLYYGIMNGPRTGPDPGQDGPEHLGA